MSVLDYVKMSPWGEKIAYLDVVYPLNRTRARMERLMREHPHSHYCEPGCQTMRNILDCYGYCTEQVKTIRQMFEEDKWRGLVIDTSAPKDIK